jgi:hypothetical protein
VPHAQKETENNDGEQSDHLFSDCGGTSRLYRILRCVSGFFSVGQARKVRSSNGFLSSDSPDGVADPESACFKLCREMVNLTTSP